MNKGLKAFYRFCDEVTACVNSGGISPIDIRKREIVEEALIDYEEMKHSFNIITFENGGLLKYKKALEIIKEKRVDTSLLFQVFDNESHIPDPLFYYNHHVDNYRPHYPLTQEEYDLLREVLL